jgi:hypothetical protein
MTMDSNQTNFNEQLNILAGPDQDRKPVGLTAHLRGLAMVLMEISAKEKDDEKKDEYFKIIFDRLEKDAEEIKQMVEGLKLDEMPEKVAMICRDVDEKFMQASNCHMEAVEMLKEYIDTEDSKLVDKTMESLKIGASLLEQADSMVWQLSQYSTEETPEKQMEI